MIDAGSLHRAVGLSPFLMEKSPYPVLTPAVPVGPDYFYRLPHRSSKEASLARQLDWGRINSTCQIRAMGKQVPCPDDTQCLPALSNHLCRIKRRLGRQQLPEDATGRAGFRSLSSLRLQ